MNENFSTLEKIITHRRNIKPDKLNGAVIPDEQFKKMLSLANWAPTHGMTEPWRFVVYDNEHAKTFCYQHAELYKTNTAPVNFQQASYHKLLTNGDRASHIIVAIMQRGNLAKIPALEEIAATACAVQNILLGAQSMGIAAYWGSGGMTHHPALKDFLELKEEDIVMGILYFGYTDTTSEGSRNVPMEEKTRWNVLQ